MKIVINNDYGGYSLSPLAIKRFAEITGQNCYFFNISYSDDDFYGYYHEISFKEANKTLFCTAFNVKNPNDYLSKFHKKPHVLKTKEEIIEENKVFNKIYLSLRMFDKDRTNPLLLQIVEELGYKANGSCASLKIINIPDDIEYQIEEYDGKEWVSEKHLQWS